MGKIIERVRAREKFAKEVRGRAAWQDAWMKQEDALDRMVERERAKRASAPPWWRILLKKLTR